MDPLTLDPSKVNSCSLSDTEQYPTKPDTYDQRTPKSGSTFQFWLQSVNSNKPTRCNRGFNCRSYCLLNMLRAPVCPSSGAQGYYTAVDACGISCCGFQVAWIVRSWGLCFRFAECMLVTLKQWLTHYSTNRHVAALIPTVIIEIFQSNNDSIRTIALGSTYPVTELSTSCVSWG